MSRRIPSSLSSRAGSASEDSEPACPSPTFEQIYADQFAPVWRAVRRFGVPAHARDDVVQQVFVAVHRQLQQYGGRCTVSTWVFAIVLRVVANYRRACRRKGAAYALMSHVQDVDELVATGESPLDHVERSQATSIAREAFSQMNDVKVATFVMFELWGLTVPEIAAASAVPINTVYSRLRHARIEFSRLVARRALCDYRENPPPAQLPSPGSVTERSGASP